MPIYTYTIKDRRYEGKKEKNERHQSSIVGEKKSTVGSAQGP